MSLVYADSSALVKLVRPEPETDVLRADLKGVDLVNSELALAEVRRALQRIAPADPKFSPTTSARPPQRAWRA